MSSDLQTNMSKFLGTHSGLKIDIYLETLNLAHREKVLIKMNQNVLQITNASLLMPIYYHELTHLFQLVNFPVFFINILKLIKPSCIEIRDIIIPEEFLIFNETLAILIEAFQMFSFYQSYSKHLTIDVSILRKSIKIITDVETKSLMDELIKKKFLDNNNNNIKQLQSTVRYFIKLIKTWDEGEIIKNVIVKLIDEEKSFLFKDFFSKVLFNFNENDIKFDFLFQERPYEHNDCPGHIWDIFNDSTKHTMFTVNPTYWNWSQENLQDAEVLIRYAIEVPGDYLRTWCNEDYNTISKLKKKYNIGF